MNGVRIAISVLLVVLITLMILGLAWTSVHQTPTQAAASRVVLGLGGAAAILGLVVIWRPRRA